MGTAPAREREAEKHDEREDAMEVAPYLNFNGNCAEAFKFYEKTLGGTIEMLSTHADSPMKDQVPPDWRDKVLHVQLKIGSFALMGSDAPAGHFAPAQGMTISLSIPTYAESERIFNQLAAGGRATMPFGKTFWSAGFGMVTDRFGTPWMVNCEQAG
jgi:PhnB protein